VFWKAVAEFDVVVCTGYDVGGSACIWIGLQAGLQFMDPVDVEFQNICFVLIHLNEDSWKLRAHSNLPNGALNVRDWRTTCSSV
jgi:hypothetical protein